MEVDGSAIFEANNVDAGSQNAADDVVENILAVGA